MGFEPITPILQVLCSAELSYSGATLHQPYLNELIRLPTRIPPPPLLLAAGLSPGVRALVRFRLGMAIRTDQSQILICVVIGVSVHVV